MNYYGYEIVRGSDLIHHGVPGMKWGVRRFTNDKGVLTDAGKRRYYTKDYVKGLNRLDRDLARAKYHLAKDNVKLQENQNRRHPNEKKVSKYSNRVKNAQRAINAGEREVNNLLNGARRNGVTINAKNITRFVSRGSRYIANHGFSHRLDIGAAIHPNPWVRKSVKRFKKYGPEAGGMISGKVYERIRK